MKLTPSQFGYIYSALQAAEREETAGERRRHSRIEIEDTVAVTDAATGRAYKAIMRDICFTGISILQSVPAAVRDQLIVDLRHRKKPYRVRCVVANVREMAEGVFCIGCAFAAAEPAANATAAATATPAADPATAAAAAAAPVAAPAPAPPAPAASPAK